jgi:hypothetical protein
MVAATQEKPLYYVKDKTFARENQVYSGHSGKGKNFNMNMSDYGKYAYAPRTEEECKKLIEKIKKDSLGKNNTQREFKWELEPCYNVELCNFYEDEDFDKREKLHKEQKEKFPNLVAIKLN